MKAFKVWFVWPLCYTTFLHLWVGLSQEALYCTCRDSALQLPLRVTCSFPPSSFYDMYDTVAQCTYIQVERGHQSTDGILRDYCDGRVFAEHTLFQAHPTALQICLYYDDLELCNPLGSKRSIHKIGIFYWTFCSMVVIRVIN